MSNKLFPSILIVDDSQTTRSMIKRILSMLEAPIGKVHEAADGAEALAALRTVRIDLVLADLNMPGMDGFEMIAQMRKDPALRSIPVLVISAQPDPKKIAMLQRQGVAGYLPKPFTPESMRKVMAPLLEHAGESACVERVGPAVSFNLSLAEALAEALETIAFMSPELVEGPGAPPLPTGFRLVGVDFKGKDTQGSLALAASPSLGLAMAANLELTNAAGADDALKELANVTCGLLLRMRPGGGVGFQLSPPHLSSPAETNPVSIFASSDVIALKADGHLIVAHVHTDAGFYGE
jgi:two-component system chemotaxis response regulator CheY